MTVSSGNARYDFDVKVYRTVIAFTKADIKDAFSYVSSLEGYDHAAKHRFVSSNPDIAKVNKNGILSPKKAGEVDITYEQKIKGGSWTQIGDKIHFYLQQPVMKNNVSIPASEQNLNAYTYLSRTTFSPGKWVSSNTKVATVDDNGNITILKPGKTNIIAQYGEGKTGSKKKFKTKLKILG